MKASWELPYKELGKKEKKLGCRRLIRVLNGESNGTSRPIIIIHSPYLGLAKILVMLLRVSLRAS